MFRALLKQTSRYFATYVILTLVGLVFFSNLDEILYSERIWHD